MRKSIIGKPPVATKKALDKFKEDNNLTKEDILNIIKNLYPKYKEDNMTDKVIFLIIKELYKFYNLSPNKEDDIKDSILSLERQGKIDLKNQERNRLMIILHELIETISKEMDNDKNKEIWVSQYQEWNSELKDFIKKEFEHWKGNFFNGKWAWGCVFRNFFEYWIYKKRNQEVPFRCLYWETYDDILFTYNKKYKYDELIGEYSPNPPGKTPKKVSLLKSIMIGLLRKSI